MTENEFLNYWNANYPKSFPVGYRLKWAYQDRWFRIHSLPKSKRYADSEEDYKIILYRQNQLIDDLIGAETEVVVSLKIYSDDIKINKHNELDNLEKYQKVSKVKLKKDKFTEDEGEIFPDLYIKKEKWRNGSNDKILKAIADDQIRAMFICPTKKCVISPYDGGVDIIVDTTEKRDELKNKYKDWYSD